MSDLTDVGEPSEVDADPDRPVGRGWIAAFALAWFGHWLLVMLPPQFMTPKLVEHVVPAHKVGVLSFLLVEGAVVTLACVPLAGWACDRTRTRFGRRRPWALGGTLLAAAPFPLIGTATSWPVIAVLMAFVAMGCAASLVALSAMIADRVPPRQRGSVSAAMGVPQVVALAVGMVVVTMVVPSIPAGWLVIAVLGVVSVLPFLLGHGEPPARAATRGEGRTPPPSPRAHPDYYWALVVRVLINAGNAAGTAYLLYFLSDVLHRDDPNGSLTVLILVYLAFCAACGYIGGKLSDLLRRRRVLVAVAGGLQALAALLLAVAPSWPSAVAGAVLLGMGYGAFLSVDQALVTDVLPNARTRARDLGIINSAQSVPIAPLLGWLVLTFVAGYRGLYAVAAVVMLFGSVAVYRIRSVR